jgi:hypothetical protein
MSAATITESIEAEVSASEIESEHFRELTASDRCHACGAQAYVISIVNGADLQYCNHHFRKYEDKLRPLSEYISDQSHKINIKPSQSTPD